MHPAVPTMESQAEVVSIVHRPATIAVTKAPTPPPPRPNQTPAPKNLSSAPPARKWPGTRGKSRRRDAGTDPRRPGSDAAADGVGRCRLRECRRSGSRRCAPSPPDIAPDARAKGTSGVALVSVRLDPNGQVLGADVTQSTGNSSLDLVAVAMARDARYSPARHDCKPVASAYTFSVKFVAW